MKTRPLRVGIIGFGRQGKVHFQSLNSFVAKKEIEVCAICDVVSDAQIGDVPFFRDAHELIDVSKPDVIILTVPNAFHFSIASYAIEHGCDVIKEKPLAISLTEGKELLRVAQKYKRLLITTQQRFYQPLFLCLKHLLPLIGKPEYFSYVFTVNDHTKSWYWEKALAGGGSWLNMGWHAVAVLEWLFGQPKSISVSWNVGGHRDWHYDTEHSALARLKYHNGLSGSIFVSCIYPKQETLKITGELGTLTVSRSGVWLNTRQGKINCFTPTSNNDAYEHQYEALIQAVQKRLYPQNRDLRILETITAGMSSAQHKGKLYDTHSGE